jgi:ketosteroid isomerase-like protein
MSVPDSIRTAMQQTNALFCASVIKNGDYEALDNIYTTGARILPPGADLISGIPQIKSFWQQAVAALGVTNATLETVDAEQTGDSVVEIGRANLTLATGQTVPVKYVVHWKQEDRLWKWNTDIWNLNQ